jgi:phosphoribosylformylglycinamidine synthase
LHPSWIIFHFSSLKEKAVMSEMIIHYYRKTEPSHGLLPSSKEQLKALGLTADAEKISRVETESCFNVQMTAELSDVQKERLEWLLAETFEKGNLHLEKSVFDSEKIDGPFLQAEFGPRMTFTSAFSSNAVSICKSCDLPVGRLELSRRYRFVLSAALSEEAIKTLKSMLHDRMTEEEYTKTLTTFDNGATAAPVTIVPIMEQGRSALEKINEEKGLGFDDFDLDYYTKLFKVSISVICRKWIQRFWTNPIFTFRRKSSAETQRMSNVSIWDNRIRNTPVTGFSEEKW